MGVFDSLRRSVGAVTKRVGGRLVRVGNNLDSQPAMSPPPQTSKAAPIDVMEKRVAPPPNIDRYPIIIGSHLTLEYISACERNALTGYRMQLVDVLSELIDHEPHGFAVLAQRILQVSGGTMTFKEADDSGRAKQIRDQIQRSIERIPELSKVKKRLLWHGLYMGLGAEEKVYERRGEGAYRNVVTDDSLAWEIAESFQIHSRRLSYPDWLYYDLHVWDQGLGGGMASNAATYGIRIDDYPQKFAVYQPCLRGEYPTREGMGRLLTTYFALKRMTIRVTATDFERFVKPWVIATYSTTFDGHPRVATDDDIRDASAAVQVLGNGQLTGAVLPDSVKLDMLRAASAMSQTEFAHYLDQAIAKAARGSTFTTEAGRFGAKGTAEVGREGELAIAKDDATQFCDMFDRDYVGSLMKLNFPSELHLAPKTQIQVEQAPDPLKSAQVLAAAVGMGMPVDGRKAAVEINVPLIGAKDANAVRLVPVAPVDPSRIDGMTHIQPLPEPAAKTPGNPVTSKEK